MLEDNKTVEQRAKFARWEVQERYFGLFDQERIICTTHSIDNAVNIIEAFRKVNAGRPFAYKAIKLDDKYDEIFDMMETWVQDETGKLVEGSYHKYTEEVYTYDKEIKTLA